MSLTVYVLERGTMKSQYTTDKSTIKMPISHWIKYTIFIAIAILGYADIKYTLVVQNTNYDRLICTLKGIGVLPSYYSENTQERSDKSDVKLTIACAVLPNKEED